MIKSIASTLLLAVAANANPRSVGVPPHSHNCVSPAGSKIALGLEKDYDMGGCKCADDTAEWGPGPGIEE